MIVYHALENERHPVPISSFRDAASMKPSLTWSDHLSLWDEVGDRLSCIFLCQELEFSSIWRCQFYLYPNLLLTYWVLLSIVPPQSMRHEDMRFQRFGFSSASLSIDGRLQILSSVLPSRYCLFASTGAALRRCYSSYSCSSIGTNYLQDSY